jgi:hypothetical protein
MGRFDRPLVLELLLYLPQPHRVRLWVLALQLGESGAIRHLHRQMQMVLDLVLDLRQDQRSQLLRLFD